MRMHQRDEEHVAQCACAIQMVKRGVVIAQSCEHGRENGGRHVTAARDLFERGGNLPRVNVAANSPEDRALKPEHRRVAP